MITIYHAPFTRSHLIRFPWSKSLSSLIASGRLDVPKGEQQGAWNTSAFSRSAGSRR